MRALKLPPADYRARLPIREVRVGKPRYSVFALRMAERSLSAEAVILQLGAGPHWPPAPFVVPPALPAVQAPVGGPWQSAREERMRAGQVWTFLHRSVAACRLFSRPPGAALPIPAER